ncbi:MAG: M24 family metallopeptidase [Promethearchaeota archaeon]
MRLEQYIEVLSELNLEGLFLHNCPNKVHLLELTEFMGGDWAIAISLRRRESLAIFVRESLTTEEIWSSSPFKTYVQTFSSLRDLFRKVGRFVRRKSIGMGFAWENEATVRQLKTEGVEVTDISAKLLTLREIKTEEEQKIVKQASFATNQAFLALIEYLQEIERGFREIEIANKIQKEMIRNGAEKLAFPTSVVSGVSPSPQQTWRLPTNRKIAKGAIILLRFGAQISYYKSALHRIILTQKKPQDIILSYDIADMVNKEHQNFLRTLISDKKIRDVIEPNKSKYPELLKKGQWILPMGHGIGLEEVEYPLLLPEEDRKLNKNTILSAGKGFMIRKKIIVLVRDMVIIKRPIEILTPSFPVVKL